MNRKQFLQSIAGAMLVAPVLRVTRAEAATALPKRLIVFQHPLGTIYDNWVPKGSETNFTLSPILAPLSAHKNDLLILDGIDLGGQIDDPVSGSRNPGNHKEVGVLLTGLGCYGRDETSYHSNISVDQHIAQRLGLRTHLKSLHIVDKEIRNVQADRILMCARGEKDPIIPLHDSARIFQDLFGSLNQVRSARTASVRATPEMMARRSVLDAVVQEIQSMQKHLSGDERQKLDQHLTHIRELEKRLAAAEADPADMGNDSSTSPTTPPMPSAQCKEPVAPKETSNIGANLRQKFDLMAQAVACDLTRIITFNHVRPGPVDAAAVNTSNFHGDFTHGNSGQAEHTNLHTWYSEQLAYLATSLKNIKEGDGTALDNTVIVSISEQGGRFFDGRGKSEHSHQKLPITLIGSCGGHFQTGKFMTYQNTKHTSLLISLMHAMGVEENSFGKVTAAPLAGLTR